MISEATQIDIKAYVWNEGVTPVELQWNGKDDYEAIRVGLCHAMEDQKKEFGKMVVLRQGADAFELFFRTFDDEHRGLQFVSGLDEKELNKSYQMQRQFCSQKVFSPQELYNLKPVRTHNFLHHFVSVHMREEIDSFDLDSDAIENDAQVELRVIADRCPDGRRTWTLETVWFKGFPVMVVNSSGRDGDEYHSRWVTDLERFMEMITYMKTFMTNHEVEGLVSPDTIIPAMTEFYNATIHDYYDVEKQEEKNELPRSVGR